MRSYPSVSVIIPAYNAAAGVRRSVDSALLQVPPPHEVIVINDGSRDETGDILLSYGERIRYVEQDNAGQGAARNIGLSMATGELIAFLDADDYWQPGFIATCSEFMETNDGAIAVSTASVVKKWGKQDSVVPTFLKDGKISPSTRVLETFFDFWGQHDHVRTGSVMMRRTVIDEAGGQRADLRISQDLEYWGYLATFGPWAFIPKPLFVTDGMPAAARAGWGKKYGERRKLCPTVNAWQQRIVPRLRDEDWAGFRQVRGRVAAGYAHVKVLGGDTTGALEIVRQFGKEMPKCWSSRLLRTGARGGVASWQLACLALNLRERAKAAYIGMKCATDSNEIELHRPLSTSDTNADRTGFQAR